MIDILEGALKDAQVYASIMVHPYYTGRHEELLFSHAHSLTPL